MKITIIKNHSAGTGRIMGEDDNLEELLRKYQMDAEVIEVSGDKIKDEVATAVKNGSNIIVVAGGDGSVSAAAGVLINKNIPLAVIPSGTLNHFAKDAGIPLGNEDAIKNILHGNTELVDMAEVNGKYFINNSSVGFYPKMVKERDKEMKYGTHKWIAMGKAFLSVFKKIPVIDVKIKADYSRKYCSTPLVFIGNNEYKTDLFNAGIRENLTGGRLNMFTPSWAGRFTLLRFALLGLINRLKEQRDFHIVHSEEIRIESSKKELEVAIDGEVIHLATPLIYKIHPLSLKIIVPEKK